MTSEDVTWRDHVYRWRHRICAVGAAISLYRAMTWRRSSGIHGHHHGQADLQIGRTRVVRNAGYPGEAAPDGEAARGDFVVEV